MGCGFTVGRLTRRAWKTAVLMEIEGNQIAGGASLQRPLRLIKKQRGGRNGRYAPARPVCRSTAAQIARERKRRRRPAPADCHWETGFDIAHRRRVAGSDRVATGSSRRVVAGDSSGTTF